MKTVSSKILGAVALIMAFTFIFVSMPIVKTNALSYSGSSSYASGRYYRQLTAIQLSGVQRADIVAVAKSQVGYQEGSNSSQLSGEKYGGGNYTEYGRWYDMQDMWCAMFVSWCANVAGISSSIITYHSYTPSGLSWFKSRGQAYSRSTVASGGYTPIAGDIIYFKSGRNSNPTNHIGIVTGYSGGTVYTVEGNTSSATVSTNGGAVAAKSYSISNTYIVYICKPAYTTGNNTTASSYVNNIDISGTESTSKTNATVSHSITATMGDDVSFQGWSVHSDGITKFQWNINNTSWGDLPEGAASLRQDVANAYSTYKNNDVNAFSYKVSTGGLNVGANTIQIRGYTKKGVAYNVATYNIFLYPQPGSTYLSVSKTSFASDEGVTFSAKGANDLAWVGLFKAGEVPGSVSSMYWCEMGKNDVTTSIPNGSDIIDNGRGELTPGEYTLYLFVDEDYTVDQKINITLTEPERAHSSLDFPNPRNFEIFQGDSFLSAGWALHPSGIASFFYTVDNGVKQGMSHLGVRTDLYAIPTYAEYSEACSDLNYYDTTVSTAGWSIGKHVVKFGAISKSGYEILLGVAEVTVKTPPVRLTVKENLGAIIDRAGDLDFVKNIQAGITVDEMKAIFNEECTIVDANGAVLTTGRVGTGCKARYYNGDVIDDEIVIIVTADIDGDGICNGKDLIRMKKFLANSASIEYESAADVNGDGHVTADDVSAAVDMMG